MYKNIKFCGMTLVEIREKLHNEYSLGELYRMRANGLLANILQTI